jgi:hypothetical protein
MLEVNKVKKEELKDFLYSGKNQKLDYQNEVSACLSAILEILMQEDLTTFDKFKELKRKYIEEIQNQQIEALTDEDIENIKAVSKFNDLFGNIF